MGSSLFITEGAGFAETEGEKSDGGILRSQMNRRSFADGLVSIRQRRMEDSSLSDNVGWRTRLYPTTSDGGLVSILHRR